MGAQTGSVGLRLARADRRSKRILRGARCVEQISAAIAGGTRGTGAASTVGAACPSPRIWRFEFARNSAIIAALPLEAQGQVCFAMLLSPKREVSHSPMKMKYSSMFRWTGSLTGTLLVAAIAVSGMWVWHQMPIYPDEIALVLSRGRFVQDHGQAYALYGALCQSASKMTPVLFVPSAWLLSQAGLALDAESMRLIPAAVVLGSFAFLIAYAWHSRRVYGAWFALASLAGVAGSGLLLARFEFAVEFNLLVCLCALALLERNAIRGTVRAICIVLLASSGVMSTYVHVQGLLFIPLTALLIYRMLTSVVRPGLAMLAGLGYAVIVIRTTLLFQSASCAGFPEIEKFWHEMTYSTASLGSQSIWRFLASGYQDYMRAFLYVDAYAVDYLPGVFAESPAQQTWLNILNGLIRLVLSLNAVMVIVIALRGVCAFGSDVIRRSGESLVRRVVAAVERRDVALAGIAIPLLFLFAYDPLHNFYRVFFLNFSASLLVAFYFSRPRFVPRWRAIQVIWAVVVATCAIASIFANVDWFADEFDGTPAKPGYEGPSLSLNRDSHALARDVQALEAACHIRPEWGGAVVDDMTYEAFKSVPAVYPITYISLQASLSHLSTADVLKRTPARFALARCASMNSVQLPYTHQQGELCCADLSSKENAP